MRANDAADRLEQIAKQGQGATHLGRPISTIMLQALIGFRLPQGPSSPDRTLLLAVDDKFTLDGDEPGVTIEGLINGGYAKLADFKT
ncbi:hypothetical protein CMI37_14480 [Candidatus Pacearchaeota archaeon]|nr:hypothetical protein [Candidatus Pacearchaeota archaeon]